jgi:hypothetical protein
MYGVEMTTMTLAIPTDLKHKLDEFPEINWSAVARQAFMEKIKDLELLRQFKAESKMTDEKALELGKKLRRQVAAKFRGEERGHRS